MVDSRNFSRSLLSAKVALLSFLLPPDYFPARAPARQEQDLTAVKTAYIFRNENDIVSFLLRTVQSPAVLLAAAPELHQSFGDDVLRSFI